MLISQVLENLSPIYGNPTKKTLKFEINIKNNNNKYLTLNLLLANFRVVTYNGKYILPSGSNISSNNFWAKNKSIITIV